MGAQGGHADAGGADADVAVHNLARLVVHLHLFLRIAVVGEDVNLRDEVESQLVGELLHGDGLAGQHLAVLLIEFLHGGGAGTAGGLVGGDVHHLDVAQLLDGFQGYDHLDGRAVGVGDDAARTNLCVGGVHFGHYQGHVGVHTEGAGVVNHHGTILRDGLGKLFGRACAGRGESYIHSLEIIVVLQEFYFDFLATERVFGPGTAFGTEQHQFVQRKIPFIEHAQELLSHGSACSHNRYFHCLFAFRWLIIQI